jgi:hypothetical protein
VTKKSNYWVFGGGLAVLLIIAPDLWREFREPGQTVWNIALATMMIGLVGAAVFGQWYFSKHSSEIGEARFDTRNEVDR